MKVRQLSWLSICGLAAMISCGDGGQDGSRGPIVLGDPSSIVSETDSQYLTDFVSDIELRAPVKDTAAAPEAETPPARDTAVARPQQAQQPAAPQGAGLNVAFKEITLFIPGIETRSFRTQNLERASGATYQLTGGKLQGNQLRITGATVQKVSQRYMTAVVAKNELGTLPLDVLNYTSEWTALKGSGNNFTISGLDPQKLETKKASATEIRNAVTRAARSKRMSRADIRKWENSVRSIRAVNQKPLASELRSVMWKVDAKDAKGKSFQKQLRIDLP